MGVQLRFLYVIFVYQLMR